jgi:hypothetical protein
MTAAALAPEFVPGPLRPPFVHSGAGREIRSAAIILLRFLETGRLKQKA